MCFFTKSLRASVLLVLGCTPRTAAAPEPTESPVPAPAPSALRRSDEAIVPPRDDSPLQTDRLVYTLAQRGLVYEAWAVVTYTNSRNSSVYFPTGCRENRPTYHIVRPEGESIRASLGLAWACVGGQPPMEIPPGTTRQDSVWLIGNASPHRNPPDDPRERVGLFRVRYRIYANVQDGREVDPLPEAERQSNIFLVQYPRN